MKSSFFIKWGLAFLFVFGALVFYKFFDPNTEAFFPKCPFLVVTGLECPGCGSQRAIHHILNFEFGAAFMKNQLLMPFLPYIFLGFYFDFYFARTEKPSEKMLKWRRRLFGLKPMYLILAIVLLFWLLRNIL